MLWSQVVLMAHGNQLSSGKAPVASVPTLHSLPLAELNPACLKKVLFCTTLQIDRGRIWTFEQEQVGLGFLT